MMRVIKKPYLKNRKLILGNGKKNIYVKSERLISGNKKSQKDGLLPIAAALAPLAPLAINGLVKIFGGGKKSTLEKFLL